MFLVRWIAALLSFPLVWAGRLLALLPRPWSVPLLKAAWSMAGDAEVAVAALRAIQQHLGPEAARAQALQWLVWRPQTEIAAWAGLMALQADDLPAARMFLSQAKLLGPDRGGLIELLEYCVASQSGDREATRELAQRFELRKDLALPVSRRVRVDLLWHALLRGRWEEAQRRADFLWSIDSDPVVAAALWALAQRNGEDRQTQKYLAAIQMPEPERLYYIALGRGAVGLREEARMTVLLLRNLDAALADRAQQYLDRTEPAA
jgi:hypothetical protein